MKALVIQNSAHADAGIVGGILTERHGFDITTVRAETADFAKLDTSGRGSRGAARLASRASMIVTFRGSKLSLGWRRAFFPTSARCSESALEARCWPPRPGPLSGPSASAIMAGSRMIPPSTRYGAVHGFAGTAIASRFRWVRICSRSTTASRRASSWATRSASSFIPRSTRRS